MKDKKRRALFVLVVERDRTVAAALAAVLHEAGYLVGTTESHLATLRIGSRMIVDAAVMDAATDSAATMEAAAALQRKYPSCRIVVICNHSQTDEVYLLAEENDLSCEVLPRPLSRAELLANLHAAPGVAHVDYISGRQLPSA